MEEDAEFSRILSSYRHFEQIGGKPTPADELIEAMATLSVQSKEELAAGKPLPYVVATQKPEFVALVKDVQNLVSTAKAEYKDITGQKEKIAQTHCTAMMKKLVAYLRDNFGSCVGLDAFDTHKAKSAEAGDPIRSPDVSIREKENGDPFESLLLVEVKSQKKTGNLLSATNNDWIGQVNTYAQRQLRKAPWLVSKYLFVTDMDIVRVCWFRRSENGPHGYVSKMSNTLQLTDPDTVMKLLYILHKSYKEDILDLESIRHSLSREVLGVGASAVVCAFGEERVIKCFFTHDKDSKASMQNELQAMDMFRAYDEKEKTGFVGKHVLRLCEKDMSGTRFIMEPKGRVLESYPPGMLKKDVFLPIVRVLKAFHASNLVHRDIGPWNLIVHGNELDSPVLCLIDFGFLKNASTCEGYSGATYFASDTILEYFRGDWNMQETPLNESADDDLESLVKTVAYCTCPFARFRIDRMRSRCRSKKYTLSRLPHVILEEWKEIRNENYHSSALLKAWKRHVKDTKKGNSYDEVEKLLSK